jgi:hypothetical protein
LPLWFRAGLAGVVYGFAWPVWIMTLFDQCGSCFGLAGSYFAQPFKLKMTKKSF